MFLPHRLVEKLQSLDVLRPESRMHWIYLVSSLALALLLFAWRRASLEGVSLRQYLFPRRVWLHRSARSDYLFVAITMPLWALLVSPWVLSVATVTRDTLSVITGLVGEWQARSEPSLAVALWYTLVVMLAGDFARYWAHRWMHTSPLLWEFHKVHHSAEVLTPITLYRVHPVENVFVNTLTALTTGIATGAFLYFFPNHLSPVTVLGVNAGKFLFNLFGVHLRHSHIWLSYGRRIEHVFLSPAQHQIHHSDDPKHFDRNFGFEFGIWDWMFGSLYVTGPEPEKLGFGLGEEENRKLATLRDLLLRPFVAIEGGWRRR